MRIATYFALIIAVATVTSQLRADTPAAATAAARQNAMRAIGELETWLGTSSRSAGWRDYLFLKELKPQLQRASPQAAVVAKSLERFSSGAAGLNQPRFVAARQALDALVKELRRPRLADIPDLARQAADDFAAVSESQFRASARALSAEVQKLERNLQRYGRAGAGWSKYLLLPTLKAQLAIPGAPDVEKLQQIEIAFRTARQVWNQPVLETAWPLLREYVRGARLRADPAAAASYTAALERIAEHLEAYVESGADSDLQEVAAAAGWLEQRGQAPQVVQALRDCFSTPNFVLRLSVPLLDRQFGGTIDENTPVNTTFMGARVSGSAATSGRLTVAPQPNAAQGVLELRVNAVTRSQTTSVGSGVRVASRDTITVRGVKRLTIDSSGWKALPADVEAQSNISYDGISSSYGRWGAGRARSSVYGRRGASERESARRAEVAAAQELDKSGRELVAKMNENYTREFRNPLLERSAFPRSLRVATQTDGLSVSILQAGPGQLGAAMSPAPPPRADATIQMHESYVANLAAAMLGGRTTPGQELRDTIGRFLGRAAAKQAPAPSDVAIAFGAEAPVSVKFVENRCRITLRGKEFVSKDRTYAAMDITAEYALQVTPAGLLLVREGKLQVYPPGFVPGAGKRLGGSQQTLRTMLERSFQKVFEEELLVERVSLEENLGLEGDLRIAACSADKGWLTIALAPAPAAKKNVTAQRTAPRQ